MSVFVPETEGEWLDLPMEVYRAAPGVSQSTLKEFGNSATALHFKTAKPKVQTKYMKLGEVGHIAALESDRLKEAYYLRPDTYPAVVKGVTVNKDWHNGADWCADWMKKHSDRPVLTAEEEAKLPKIVAGLAKLEEFSSALANGQKEVSFFKRDSETGLLLKARCDLVATDSDGFSWIWDLKKCQVGGATHAEFSKSCFDYGYHIQCAAYRYITGASRFVFVPFDDAEPFDAAQFEPDSDMISAGWKEYRRLLNAYAACVTSGEWNGYSHEIAPLMLPGWVKRKEKYGD